MTVGPRRNSQSLQNSASHYPTSSYYDSEDDIPTVQIFAKYMAGEDLMESSFLPQIGSITQIDNPRYF
ncbi:hypothetical protein HZS_5725 [Henneguya salminicola]|nr:hypothetical protein HZS_5725 [Henneguya salminicola]